MGKRVKSIFNIVLIIFLFCAFLYFFYRKSIIEGARTEAGTGTGTGAGAGAGAGAVKVSEGQL